MQVARSQALPGDALQGRLRLPCSTELSFAGFQQRGFVDGFVPIIGRRSRLQAPTGARFDSPGRLALGSLESSTAKPQRGEMSSMCVMSGIANLAPMGLHCSIAEEKPDTKSSLSPPTVEHARLCLPSSRHWQLQPIRGRAYMVPARRDSRAEPGNEAGGSSRYEMC